MDFPSMVTFITAKVQKTDSYSQARCLDYVKARHKMIYEGYDWKAAQIIVPKTISAGGGTTTTLTVSEVHHVLSMRLDGKLLDPVSASFIFDHSTQVLDEYATAGIPTYYEEFYDSTSGVRSVRFFPPLADDGNSHALVILGKKPYDDTWTSPAIPQTENALIAFVLGDMWEYMNEVAKGQIKLQEGLQILQKAVEQDTPSALRPRSTKTITPSGNSLGEMTDAVCDICGDWTPQTRISIKDRIRRNYQTVWDAANWPESMILDTETASLDPDSGNNDIVILSHLLDKVIAVRINVNLSTNNFYSPNYEDMSVFFGIKPEMFNLTGQPVTYSLLSSVALPAPLSNDSFLKFSFTGAEVKTPIFVRGEVNGTNVYETVYVTGTATTQTVNVYDVVYTISKPQTVYNLTVQDSANNTLMTLMATGQSRKHQRIRVFPAFTTTADKTVFVLGKRIVPALYDDGDTCALSSCENILINGAASDILYKVGNVALAGVLQTKAIASLKILSDKEVSQSTYAPRITPYTEIGPFTSAGDSLSDADYYVGK